MADLIISGALHFPTKTHSVKYNKIELENMAQASLYDCKISKKPLPFAYHMAHINNQSVWDWNAVAAVVTVCSKCT